MTEFAALRKDVRKWSNHRDREPSLRCLGLLVNNVLAELESDPTDERFKQMLEQRVRDLYLDRFGAEPDWAAGWNWVAGQRMARS